MNRAIHSLPTSTNRTRSSRSARGAATAVLLLGTLLFGACSGGGSGRGPSGPSLNEGSFSVDDFDYHDNHPPGYQPLGQDGYQVLAREELFATWPGPDGFAHECAMQDGPDANYLSIPEVADLFQGLGVVQAAASGQLDQDPESELVVATLENAGATLTLHRVDRLPSGQYTRQTIETINAGSWVFADVRLTLSDIDHDFRDEIVVVARSARFGLPATYGEVWVFDDPEAGGVQLLDYERTGAHIDLWGLPIDVDGDQRKELVVGLSGDSTNPGRYAVRQYRLDEGEQSMQEVHDWLYLYVGNDQRDSRAVVGDFDGDGREDLAWVGYKLSNWTEMSIRLFEYGPDVAWHQYSGVALIDVSPAPAFKPQNWAVVSFHPDVRGTDLALAYPDGGAYTYTTLHYDTVQQDLVTHSGSIDRYQSGQGIALAASDVDADGAEEVQVGLLQYDTSSGTLDLGYLENGDTIELVWQDPVTLPSGPTLSGVPPVPVLAPGDYDADGFALQSTAVHMLKLGDPVPLVLLSAPPTVAGISQNYGSTESSYEASVSNGNSIGVSTYTSMTYSAGTGFDLFGILGVQGRASLEKGVERTQTTTRRETVVQGYSGSADADVIVFQGTLYESYEYQIVAAPDPAAIGSYVTLDIPVDANTYKWTVPYYNQHVAPEDQIGTDVLTHTPGDLQSYPTRDVLQALMLGEMHWDLPGVHPVGQGNSSDSQSVSFETEQTTEEQRTISKAYGGGASFGIDVDAESTSAQGATQSTSYAFETTFEARVGDISDPADYDDYRYNWGFSVHTVGRLADPSNEPAGYSSSKHCYEYLRYWAEPTGAGF